MTRKPAIAKLPAAWGLHLHAEEVARTCMHDASSVFVELTMMATPPIRRRRGSAGRRSRSVELWPVRSSRGRHP